MLYAIVLFLTLLFGCTESETMQMSNAPDSMAAEIQVKQTVADNPVVLNYDQRRGKWLYENYCVVCHGSGGQGDGFNAFNLDPRPGNLADSIFLANVSDPSLKQIIVFGGRGVNRSVLMPAYQKTLNNAQIDYLVQYIRTLGRPPSKH